MINEETPTFRSATNFISTSSSMLCYFVAYLVPQVILKKLWVFFFSVTTRRVSGSHWNLEADSG